MQEKLIFKIFSDKLLTSYVQITQLSTKIKMYKEQILPVTQRKFNKYRLLGRKETLVTAAKHYCQINLNLIMPVNS